MVRKLSLNASREDDPHAFEKPKRWARRSNASSAGTVSPRSAWAMPSIEFRDLFRRKASETSALFRSFRKLLDQFAPLGRRECLEQFEDALSGFGHGLENSTKGASCEAAELLVLLVDSNSAAFVNGPKF
jgi:hypothetical protein